MEAHTDQAIAFRKLIKETTGIDLGTDKDYLITSRLTTLLADFGLANFQELHENIAARKNEELLKQFVERITTHETLFFRDESIFTALSTQIGPEWLSRNRMDPEARFKIWCAACSTGQEPYSVLILFHHLLPHIFDRIEMVASDISSVSLDRARNGIFTRYETSRGLSAELLGRYFREQGGEFVLSPQIRNRVQFFQHNLKDMPYRGNFDLILCRNVLIYFDHDLRRQILENFRRIMRPDGALVLGSAETVDGYITNYVLRTCGLARYYELNDSKVTIFRKPESTL